MNDTEIIKLIDHNKKEIVRLTKEIDILNQKLNQEKNDAKILTQEDKIKIFMDYFKGRTDVYPSMRYDKVTNKIAYFPLCQNAFKSGVCNLTKNQKCNTCQYRQNTQLT